MSSEQRNTDRQRLRNRLREKRSNLPTPILHSAEHALAANVAFCLQQLTKQLAAQSPDSLAALPTGQQSRRVGGYRAVNGEISLHTSLQWLRDNNCLTYLPVVTGQTLMFVPCDENTRFTRGKYNIDVPLFQQADVIEAAQLDIVLVPLLGFDIDGNRLGMGGGYYDRSFAFRMQASSGQSNRQQKHSQQLFIGVAHEFQRTDTLPFEKWDVPLDAIITDKNIYHCGPYKTTGQGAKQ